MGESDVILQFLLIRMVCFKMAFAQQQDQFIQTQQQPWPLLTLTLKCKAGFRDTVQVSENYLVIIPWKTMTRL